MAVSTVKGAMPDKRLLRIIPVSFLASFAIGIINLGMLFLIKGAYGASPAVVGWFTALWSAAYFAGCILFRPLSKKLDASASAIIMCLASAVLLGLHLLVPSLASAFVTYTLFGLAIALLWPRLMGWLSSGLEGDTLSRANGAFSLSWSAGGTVAPFVAGLLAERGHLLGLGWVLPVYAGIALFMATGLFMLLSSRLAPAPGGGLSSAKAGAGVEAATRTAGRSPAATDQSTQLRYPGWIALFAVYVLQAVLTNIFPLYAKDELAMGEASIGLFLLFRAAALAAGFFLFARLRFWRFKAHYLPLSLAAIICLDGSFVLARGLPALALLMTLLGLVQSFIYSLALFYGSSGAPNRDRRMSIHEAVLTVGQILGSVGGGAVYESQSWPLVFVLGGGLSLLLLPLQLRFSRRR